VSREKTHWTLTRFRKDDTQNRRRPRNDLSLCLHQIPTTMISLLFGPHCDPRISLCRDSHGVFPLFIRKAARSLAIRAYYTQTTRCPARVMRLVLGQIKSNVSTVYLLSAYIRTQRFLSLCQLPGFILPHVSQRTSPPSVMVSPHRYDHQLTTRP
jgi:hypothetical protein